MSQVFVIGFMGAGKSTAGRLLADEIGLPFVDVDAEIERRDGRSVAEIFSQDGEAAFREIEREEIARAAFGSPAVVACGGGAVTVAANRDTMRRTGTVVLLRVTAEEAVARVGSDGTRPLLAGDPRGRAERLLSERERFYEDVADVVVDTVGRTPEQVASAAAALLDRHGAEGAAPRGGER